MWLERLITNEAFMSSSALTSSMSTSPLESRSKSVNIRVMAVPLPCLARKKSKTGFQRRRRSRPSRAEAEEAEEAAARAARRPELMPRGSKA